MRVVMLAHSFPRWPGDVAGSFLLRLAEALVAKGHTVSVVAPADQGKGGRLRLGSVDILQVRYASPERENLAYVGDMGEKARSFSGARAFLSLVRAMRRGAAEESRRINADVLHAFWWVPGGWAAAGNKLPPAALTLMGTDVAMMRSLPARFLAGRVLGRMAHLSALSTYLADETRRVIGRSFDIARIPVPVDTTRFDGAPQPGDGGIVYLGRLTRQKRVWLLLDAIHAARITAPVTIVGDGPARAELEQQARGHGLSNVTFLGQVPDEEVPRRIRSAGVAAFLSEREGLGLAAAEAQMMGTPVVATTDGGGVLDLVRDGEGARVVAPDPLAVGEALKASLADVSMRDAAIRAGARLRHELSPEGVAGQFEQVYARII